MALFQGTVWRDWGKIIQNGGVSAYLLNVTATPTVGLPPNHI
jgi:hypothetical protein